MWNHEDVFLLLSVGALQHTHLLDDIIALQPFQGILISIFYSDGLQGSQSDPALPIIHHADRTLECFTRPRWTTVDV